jgi:hypothetical protein
VIQLEPWGEADMPLLVRLNAPEMTEHIGGPETPEQLARRMLRYVAATQPNARMFKVMVDGEAAGGVGFWQSGTAKMFTRPGGAWCQSFKGVRSRRRPCSCSLGRLGR